jgi:LmbE family N-acetylglucosaminyl deacetylase
MQRVIFLSSCILLCSSTIILQKNKIKLDQTILAIFALPDDELLTGTTLAHYASKGVKVYVAIATDGALGTTDFANIPAGRELVEVRQNEMICSAEALGIEPPILLGLPDQLNTLNGGLQEEIDVLGMKVDSLINTYRPNVIITFGAAGWTGHPDHRLVGNVVTDVFASHSWDWQPKLYYSELVSSTINEKSWAKYLTVQSIYLPVN